MGAHIVDDLAHAREQVVRTQVERGERSATRISTSA
jgi:hypothetical protein